MADCVLSLMGLHSADRRRPQPSTGGNGCRPSLPRAGGTALGGTLFGLDQPLPPADAEGIAVISRTGHHLPGVNTLPATLGPRAGPLRARSGGQADQLACRVSDAEHSGPGTRRGMRTRIVKPHLTTMMGLASGARLGHAGPLPAGHTDQDGSIRAAPAGTRSVSRRPARGFGHSAPPALTPVHPGCRDR
jgi:hypothetical protein